LLAAHCGLHARNHLGAEAALRPEFGAASGVATEPEVARPAEIDSMSLINTEIKPFKATAYHNGKFVPVLRNEDLKGKWSVLVFYPADFTFVCPTELGDLADNYAAFKKLGVEIYGVSTDTHFAHKAWHDTSDTIAKVQYPLVGDPTHALWRAISAC
jgi:alkyl hydroperoxide reductase subunit AhpC